MTRKLAGMVSGLVGLIDPCAVLEVVATGSAWSEGPLCNSCAGLSALERYPKRSDPRVRSGNRRGDRLRHRRGVH